MGTWYPRPADVTADVPPPSLPPAAAQVRWMEGGEPACRPGSVRPLARGGGHPSGTAVAGSLVRPTREHRAGRPRTLAQGTVVPLLALLRVGFTEPPQSPAALVVSYTAFSPLPPRKRGGGLFSVALSRGSPRVGVTDHPALWSPDLPHRTLRPGATARPTHPRSGYADGRLDRASAGLGVLGGPGVDDVEHGPGRFGRDEAEHVLQ
jgi:hypothetical protein